MIRPSEISTEGQGARLAPVEAYSDRGRSENVTRAAEDGSKSVSNLDFFVKGDGNEIRQHLLCVFLRKERQRDFVFRSAAPVVVGGLFVLEVRAVRKNDLAQALGLAGRVDRAAKPRVVEGGQIAGVVDVGVGEQNRVDALGRHRELRPVAQSISLQTLVEAAVDEDARRRRIDQEAAARDRARSAEKAEAFEPN